MGKSTKKKNKKITAPKANIQELSISRDGGQIALRGYSYQFLYSCYLILSSSNPSNFFQLEGIEDIDCIMQKNGSNDITHIQLKYSVNKQDASFLTDVLKNFLEAYLLDQNRFFKLVYDFPVAKGHLSKIFASKLDEKSRTHWAGVISNIKKNNPSWNWSVYDFDKFISHLSFEKIEKSILATEIEKTLIRIYEINTDNVSLFANSIKILCFEKMEQRAYVTKAELDSKIQSVKIDISKGPQNPAHSWIRKLDYSKPSIDEGCSFYEGKKATPADIVSGFPIKRPSCGYCDPQRCSRNLLVSKNQTFQWNIQCTAGCRQIYVIFIQRFEQIRCCDIVSRGFEIQLVCERCIFNYGDYGCLPVVTFFAFRTLRSSVAFFHGIALFAFRLSVTLVTFFPLYTLFPSVTRL